MSGPALQGQIIIGLNLLWRAAPERRWAALALAVVVGCADRAGVILVADLVTGEGAALSWQSAMAVMSALISIAARRWAILSGLRIAEQAADAAVLGFAHHVAGAELAGVERAGAAHRRATLKECADSLLENGSAAIMALPACMTVAVSLGWLAGQQPVLLVAVAMVAAIAIPSLRHGERTAAASESRLSAAESAFLDVSSRATRDAVSQHPWAPVSRMFRERELWPVIDAAAGAATAAGRAHARLAALTGFLGFTLIVLLIAFGAGASADAGGRVALLLALATLPPAVRTIEALPALRRVATAAAGVEALVADLTPAPRFPALRLPMRESIALRGVTYVHRDAAGDESALVGPLDFELRRGEVVALIGGNGSGKTTLTRLLCGLYTPREGMILLDGQPVSPAAPRSICGGVLADFHLFAAPREPALAESGRAATLLERFELDRVVRVKNGGIVPLGLTERQRGRLAMVIADLEDRPVRIYDGWAARQEPRFRELFYRTLLAEQRARGCAVLVIGDDAALVECATRVVRMEEGRIAEEYPGGAAA